MEKWLNKNLRWVTIIIVVLFVFKSVQSCNRDSRINSTSKKYENIIDSLKTEYNNYYRISQDSIKQLNFELKLANEHAISAKDRANAVQKAVEKLKSNTTVVVKGAEKIDQ